MTNIRRTVAVIAQVGLLAAVLAVSHGQPAPTVPSTWCSDPSSIIVLGDSMSSGHGATDPGNAWVERIELAYPGAAVTNLATNGALTSDFLPAGVGVQPRPAGNLKPGTVDQIMLAQPSLVIVATGGNEYGTDRHPVSTYGANLQDLTDRIQSASLRSTLLFVHTTGFDYRWATPPIDHAWVDYGAAMDTVASAEAAGYLDLTEFLPWADTDTASLYVVDEYGPGNTVHWRDAGHVAAGGVIHQQLRACGEVTP